ncbi:MAG: flagellar biosynthesis protein FlgA [Myxococcales bacterium]|nr:flagellar biosynthesis protein FlgA [Myxococcales bacterium]
MNTPHTTPHRPSLLTLGVALLAALVTLAAPLDADAARIKDLANIRGVRANQLTGYGLVVGLQGTGDSQQARFTVQSVANMLTRMGIRIDPKTFITRNVAAVIVTAELPPFARVGDRLDVEVSSLGDAKSLVGGMLLMTPLLAADQNVYAVAQGPLVIGGFGSSAGGNSSQSGHLTVGRIADGALVERELESAFTKREQLIISLKQADFTTASRMATAINLATGAEIARTIDGGTIEVKVPPAYRDRAADFIASIERIDIIPDRKARVVINERSGTVVIGADVQISTVGISHGSLSIEVRKRNEVSQPYPFSLGGTVPFDNTEIEIAEESGEVTVLPGGVSIGDLAKALNAMGVSPRDLASIFQALKAAGALNADIIVQ